MRAIVSVVLVAVLCSGCASVLVNRGLQKPIMVKAEDGNMVRVGVNLYDLKTAQQHPWISLGAAIVDGVAAYYAVDTLDHYASKDDSPPQPTYNAENVYVIDTSGSGNEVYINSNTGNTTGGE